MLSPSKFLTVSAADRRLYQRSPGDAAWSLFLVQPPYTPGSDQSPICCGLPNGSIIVCDASGGRFLHWDSATGAWVNRGHPGAPLAWTYVQAVGIDCAVAQAAQWIAWFNGTTWVRIGDFGFMPVIGRGCWASSLNDIWAAYGSGGIGYLWHYDGSVWTDLYPQMCSDLGWSPNFPCKVWGFGPTEVLITTFWERQIIKYNGVSFSLCATAPHYIGEALWGTDGTHLWTMGSAYAAFDYHIYFFDGSAWFLRKEHPGPSVNGFLNQIIGLDNLRLLAHAYNGAVQNYWESQDSGLSWVLTTGFTSADVGQVAVLWTELTPSILLAPQNIQESEWLLGSSALDSLFLAPQHIEEPEWLLGSSALGVPEIGLAPQNIQESEWLSGMSCTQPSIGTSPIFQVCPFGYG